MPPVPAWVFVNLREKARDGYPFYFLTRGGKGTPLPLTAPVFSSQERAMQVTRGESWYADHKPNIQEPFIAKEMNLDQFREFLDEARKGGVESIIIDMGTEDVMQYPISKLIDEVG